MATVRYCDRHFRYGKRVDAKQTGVSVEIDGIKTQLDLCKLCLSAIESWQELVRESTTDDGVRTPADSHHRAAETPRFLYSQSSA
jgi:hypothetical protein